MSRRDPYLRKATPPPSFEESTNIRQKVRSAGMNPNYWYAVEYDAAIGRRDVKEVIFWKRSIAVFRGDDGVLRAVENRCAHRQLRLTTGHVDGCNLVCPYHGWAYDGEGRVVDIPHSLFGRKFPKFKIPSLPVRVRYGLIWVFFGDAKRADTVEIPRIPELEGPDAWTCVPVDATWQAHHSMIMDNVSDFTHAYLHRRFRPFDDAELLSYETVGDTVFLEYDTKVGGGRFSGLFIDRKSVDMSSMKLGYQYPYQFSNTDDQIKHWLFVLPIDERTTRAFFLFCFKSFKIPFTPARIPKTLMRPFMRIANELSIKPLLAEDGEAVEEEQRGWEAHWDAPLAEINPVVRSFQNLTVRKWQEYLDEKGLSQLRKKDSGAKSATQEATR
ncbi:MAG: aromatic ring-hydroxylating dioxygenase subunit alpha [Myxococcota bacterium]